MNACPTPTVTWAGADKAHPGSFKVIVRHGSRVAHHDRLTAEQADALVASPSLAKPARTTVDPQEAIERLYGRLGLPVPGRAA